MFGFFKAPDLDKVAKSAVDERLAEGLFEKDIEEAKKRKEEKDKSLSSFFPEKEEPKKKSMLWGLLLKRD
ncbi:MAG: hypothetical protein COY40_05225 [Alphaproteobacteria bacterium CG_4_10_14_0_8_um_filter_53_9]|nr:MAG: hypothetical protein COY40_05225 [Alphaproteobacteria bacterium CG_4_10_14_0_8_um_filter_53_9]